MKRLVLLVALLSIASLGGCKEFLAALVGHLVWCDTGFSNHSSHVVSVRTQCPSSQRDYDQFTLAPGASHTFTHPSAWDGNQYHDDVQFAYTPTDTVRCTTAGYWEENITFFDK